MTKKKTSRMSCVESLRVTVSRRVRERLWVEEVDRRRGGQREACKAKLSLCFPTDGSGEECVPSASPPHSPL